MCSVGLIAHRGGRVGQQAAFAIMLAAVTTLTLHVHFGIERSQPFVLFVDCALLAYISVIAQRAASYWPIWFAGFHSVAVATGLARMIFPVSVLQIYIDASEFWALPALGAAVAGILLDRRAGLPT